MKEQESLSTEQKQEGNENQNLKSEPTRPLLILQLHSPISDVAYDFNYERLSVFAKQNGYDFLIAHENMEFQVAPSLDGICNAILEQGNAINQMAAAITDLIATMAEDEEEAEPQTYLDGSLVAVPGDE